MAMVHETLASIPPLPPPLPAAAAAATGMTVDGYGFAGVLSGLSPQASPLTMMASFEASIDKDM